jgi:hypothetical protein
MKKEFIDYMYELKSLIQSDIDRLVDRSDLVQVKCCENMPNQNEDQAELRTRRSQIGSLNETIQKYFDTHY